MPRLRRARYNGRTVDNAIIPLLFDTDIGSDIDDAVALTYLLRQPRCHLLGVTTATGDTTKRAALVEIVCAAAGRPDVPVHAGLTGPLLSGSGQPDVPHYEAVKNRPHRTDYAAGGGAVDFLRQAIRARPGEVTLLAVGPMTNVAALAACDPHALGMLRRIVLMAGVFTGASGHGPGAREWNVLCDPAASALVFKHAPPGTLLSVGLDVTTRCALPADECRSRFARAGGALGVVAEMAEVWFKHRDRITFHDPLAAALVFAPELCTYATGQVTVVADDTPLAGLTRWKADPAGPHTVVATVNPDAFFAHYFAVAGAA